MSDQFRKGTHENEQELRLHHRRCRLVGLCNGEPIVRRLHGIRTDDRERPPEHTSPLIAMPRGIGKLLAPGNPHVWDYEACRGEGMASALWLKGKAIGGSSSVNGMVYVRGAPADYDAWEAMGCDGWGWRDMGRQFVALEDHQLGSSQWRGGGGGYKSCGFGQWRWLWISATDYLGGGAAL